MYLVEAKNVREAAYKTMLLIEEKGSHEDSRNGPVKFVNRVLVHVDDAVNRWLVLNGRNNSIVATVAEIMWVLSGRANVSDWLVKYLPRATDYSDDGVNWRAAYGPRIYMNGQLQTVIDKLRESPNTRQAMISIVDPARDTHEGLIKEIGHTKTKDTPCNNLLYFFVEDGKLCLHVTNRSNDVIWGAWSINFQEFTVLQEIVSLMTGIPIGSYSVYQNNLHVYTANEIAYKQFKAVINTPQDPIFDSSQSTLMIGNIKAASDLQFFFTHLTAALRDGKDYSSVLQEYEINDCSLIGDWCRLLTAYDKKKAGKSYDLFINDSHLNYAIKNDKFNSDLLC